MKSKTLFSVAALVLVSFSGPALAADHGWITSIPMARPSDNAYPVNIQRINDKQPIDAQRYRVDAGEIKVRVSVVTNPTDLPKLRIANDEISAREFTMTVEPGVTYQIAGKVNPDASDEEQRNGTFWEPIVYKETQEK